MSVIVWGQPDQRRYESGVSNGVLYPLGGPGVVWNGLTSVEESIDGGDTEQIYFEGIKIRDVVSSKFFQAKIQAYSAPAEFGPCDGLRSIIPGVILTRQPRVGFSLSYRTGVNQEDYKLHLVYNAIATQTGRGYQTLSATPSPTMLEWTIDAVPPMVNGYKPTAHFVLDSTKTDFRTLAVLEQHLYGTPTKPPYLPTQGFIEEVLKADPEVIDGGSSSFSTPDILDGGRSADGVVAVVDGRHSWTRRLDEFLYV